MVDAREIVESFKCLSDRDKEYVLEEVRAAKDICGCGEPELAENFLIRILERFEVENPNGRMLETLIPDEGTMWFCLYMLDALGLIDHGGTVSNGWLTDEGKAFLALHREGR